MSRRGLRLVLFAGLALVCPVPLLALGPGHVPAARLLELGGVTAAVMLLENGGGVAGALVALFVLQAALWLALFWVGAGLAARALSRLGARRAAVLAWALVAAGAVVATSADVYRTPFGTQARARLGTVYR